MAYYKIRMTIRKENGEMYSEDITEVQASDLMDAINQVVKMPKFNDGYEWNATKAEKMI